MRLFVLAGVLASLALVLFGDLDPGNPAVTRTAAVVVLMAVLWMTEIIPLAVTSLLPLVLLPLLGVMPGKAVASQYLNDLIFLMIGGFIVALAMERWELHKRIALRVLLFFGNSPRRILLGFMVATAFLSMWISNTAAAMMMISIVFALILKMEQDQGTLVTAGISKGLLLGVAYSASIGGIATLVGTPPNLVFAAIFKARFPGAPEVTFASWIAFALPVSVVMLALVWVLLSLRYMPGKQTLTFDEKLLRSRYAELGRLTYEEKIVLADFACLVFLWVFRGDIDAGIVTIPGWSRLFPDPAFVDDGVVAVAMAVILFMIPARREPGVRIMDWPAAAKLPWNVVLLFGGGLALAKAFDTSGLSDWIGAQLSAAQSLHPFLLVTLVSTAITFLTELTSNTATSNMILPILAGVAVAIDVHPMFLMIPATISCSCAFMLPVATPPNSIVFGTQRLRVLDMAATGLLINCIGVVVIVLAMYLLGGAVWGIDLARMPDWAGGSP